MEKNLLDSLVAINPDISATEGGKTQIEGVDPMQGRKEEGSVNPAHWRERSTTPEKT